MKRIRCLPALLAAVLLMGCAAHEAEPAASAGTGGTDERVGLAAGSMSSARTEQDSRDLSDAEVLAAYERAAAAYGWFRRATLPGGEPSVTADGQEFQPVEYAGIGTVEELRTYLRGLFSAAVVDRLLPEGGSELYRDIDGVLHVCPTAWDRDAGKGRVSMMVERRSAVSYSVNVTVELLDDDRGTVTGVECYAFPYEWNEGRWVFTDFDLVN